MATEKQQCSVMVYGSGRYDSFHPYHCSKPAKVEVDGKWYCAIHSPDAVKQRKAVATAKRRER